MIFKKRPLNHLQGTFLSLFLHFINGNTDVITIKLKNPPLLNEGFMKRERL